MNYSPESINPQGVGSNYNYEEFKKSQSIGWEILSDLKEKIQPGMTEENGREEYSQVLKKFGIEKNWHLPKIRFGPNTTKSFKQLSDENYKLKEADIYFIDIGPIINGYEADVGQTFTIGKNTILGHQKISKDGLEIFNIVKNQFLVHQLKGPDLYQFAEAEAHKKGWQLIDDGANGHRIGDFPHHTFYRGSLRGFEDQLIPHLWILEIQLRSPDQTFGSFYEDVLG